MKRRLKVYVAGPYTKPDPVENVRKAILAADELWSLGYTPFVPHLTHLWHLVSPHPYEHWLEYDNEFLPCCHAVLRLPGESSGADKECRLAESLSVPVFDSIAGLDEFFKRVFGK